jgi:hypothetical protein
MLIILIAIGIVVLALSLKRADTQHFEEWRREQPSGEHRVYAGENSSGAEVLGVVLVAALIMLFLFMLLPH